MTPFNINKKIRQACKALGINKPITNYSFKRNGVTYQKLQGYSDTDIQHRAGWTSTRQLETYDLSEQSEAFNLRLIKQGLRSPEENNLLFQNQKKKCYFCDKINGIADTICDN